MPTARYFIVHDQIQDEWHIKYGDEEYGPYKTQDEAMVFAIDAAQKLGAYGESAEVCLMGENGHFHAEWVAGATIMPNRREPEQRAELSFFEFGVRAAGLPHATTYAS